MDIRIDTEGFDRLAKKGARYSQIARKELEIALFASALMIEKEAKQSIASGTKSGRTYKRGNVTHRASAPGEAPASDTGRLINSINARMSKEEIASEVKAGGGIVKYARMLEFGTSKMAARPFLFPAAEKSKPAIRKRIAKAVDMAGEKAAKS